MAKSRKPKPSFDAPLNAPPLETPAWVYRTDVPAGATRAATKAARTAKAQAPSAEATAAEPTTPAEAPATAPATAAPPPPVTDRARGANALIERYATYSAAAGLVPVPAIDAAAIAAVQVQMLRALAAHYTVPFSQERGQALIAALVGGVMPSLAGYQCLKLAGPLAGILGISGFAMTSTWAVGRVFVAHFETGGTLIDLNVEESKRRMSAALRRP
jgi:uncharacterized protein (DUF697 family)